VGSRDYESSTESSPLTPASLTSRKSSRIDRKLSTKLSDFTGNALKRLFVSDVVQSTDDEIADLLHLLLFHTSRRHRRGSESNAAGYKRRACVEWDGIFVDRDTRLIERLLCNLPGQFRFA
jgi:hypothetical protein